MSKVYDFLKEAGTYYLATVEGDQPRVRPFGTIDLFEDKLYILTSKTKNVSKQIQQNGKVEIVAYKEPTWVRITGTLVRDDRKEPKEHLLDAYPHLRDVNAFNDENREVLYLKDAVAVFYTNGKEPEIVRL